MAHSMVPRCDAALMTASLQSNKRRLVLQSKHLQLATRECNTAQHIYMLISNAEGVMIT